jgi:hypothetical protein
MSLQNCQAAMRYHKVFTSLGLNHGQINQVVVMAHTFSKYKLIFLKKHPLRACLHITIMIEYSFRCLDQSVALEPSNLPTRV